MSRIAIIGGGASGVICSIFASKKNDVTLFCCDDKVGKKLLVTGNGKCNITNLKNFGMAYNTDITKYLKKFDQMQTIKFFSNLGLVTYSDQEQRVYPFSNSASSVIDVLNIKLKKCGVEVKLNEEVICVEQLKNKFKITTTLQSYIYDKVVVSVGSNNKLLEQLHIKYKPFTPSLVSLKTKEDTHSLAGLRLSNVEVLLNLNNKKIFEKGEVLFKDKGISGICIFNLSAYLARQNNYNARISIDMMPSYTHEKLLNLLQERLKCDFHNAKEFMQGFFNEKINNYILKTCKIKNEDKITEKNICQLAKAIKQLKFNVIGHYENNQVKSGGILLENLTDALQYKYVNNLFFTGEIIDVDGICGGYNLQWAWTSGKIVGENI